MLEHGGRLRNLADSLACDPAELLDLSTGLNPVAYPVPDIPPQLWQNLPDLDDQLVQAACDYYEVDALIFANGSQQIIQSLPRILSPCQVMIPQPMYQEHEYHWRAAGHEIIHFDALAEKSLFDQLQQSQALVLVLVNPSNPLATYYDRDELLACLELLRQRQGYLIVDEAFMDVEPQQSLASVCQAQAQGLIIIRSLGKFFGLAGMRVGFAFGDPTLLAQLHNIIGPWSINHPAQYISIQVLLDRDWQVKTRERLRAQGAKMSQILGQYFTAEVSSHALFSTVILSCEQARAWYQAGRQAKILLRLIEVNPNQAILRFGTLALDDIAAWQRLHQFLANTRLAVSTLG